MQDDLAGLIAGPHMMAGRCGHHYDANCSSCHGALEVTNNELRNLRTALETLTRENAELKAAKWDVKHTSTTETLVQQGLAIESLNADLDEARTEIERLKLSAAEDRLTIADLAGARDEACTQLTTTQARLEDAVRLLCDAGTLSVRMEMPTPWHDDRRAFLDQQEGQSNG